jgi:hypothetical protein
LGRLVLRLTTAFILLPLSALTTVPLVLLLLLIAFARPTLIALARLAPSLISHSDLPGKTSSSTGQPTEFPIREPMSCINSFKKTSVTHLDNLASRL